jgi:SARP family transcriptional regulator, regulator of embCAB operon
MIESSLPIEGEGLCEAVIRMPLQMAQEGRTTSGRCAPGRPDEAADLGLPLPIEIQVLGPLQVTIDQLPAKPAEARLRQLLALFAVYADRVVPPQVMVEELWPEGAPPGALSELHRDVARLRNTLARSGETAAPRGAHGSPGGAGRVPLVPARGGYRLDCSYATLDVRRFERDSGAGFRALAAGDVETAARRLTSALLLWTGDALADVPAGPHLRREIELLTAARKQVADQWAEAELRRDRPHEPPADVTGVTSLYREALREHFLAELRRNADGTGAVEAFERVRGTLPRTAEAGSPVNRRCPPPPVLARAW